MKCCCCLKVKCCLRCCCLISWRRITYGQSDTELVHKMLLRCNSGATRPCGPRAQDVKDASCRDEDATPWGISCSKMKICASVFHGMKICASIFPRARGQVFRPLFELGWIKYNSRVCSACSSPCCAWIESEDKLNSMLCMYNRWEPAEAWERSGT